MYAMWDFLLQFSLVEFSDDADGQLHPEYAKFAGLTLSMISKLSKVMLPPLLGISHKMFF